MYSSVVKDWTLWLDLRLNHQIFRRFPTIIRVPVSSGSGLSLCLPRQNREHWPPLLIPLSLMLTSLLFIIRLRDDVSVIIS
jgi:hypothetical protein